jgi:lysyl-tRNA synthetase class II
LDGPSARTCSFLKYAPTPNTEPVRHKSDADVEEYIGIFEDMGYFIKDNLITAKMSYDHFSYDIEKAWCNVTVQETINKVRAVDKSKTVQSDPLYGNFERLAKQYLDDEGQTCKDLDKQ